MLHTFRSYTTLLLFLLLSGCSHIQEGQTDYSLTVSEVTNCVSNNAPDDSEAKCQELSSARYLDDNQVSNPIRANDTLSIHLAQGFIKEFPEWILPTKGEYTPGSANGEIAIVVHACEQGIDGCDLLPQNKSRKEGRVVYYSDGVRENQALNLSYLPIYGPITYTGKPVILQLHIIELDIQGEQSSNLIKTLASLGQGKFAPASTSLSILEDLGLSLLQGEQHDRIFSYSMVLAPEGGVSGVSYPHLSAGNYIFLRQDIDKAKQPVPASLKFDKGRGRLVSCSASRCQDYMDNTYLVVQIQKGFAEASLDKEQTLSKLIKELQAEQDAEASKIDAIWQARKSQIINETHFANLSGLLSSLEQKLMPEPKDKNAEGYAEWQRKRDQRKIQATIFTDQFRLALQAYRSKLCGGATPKPSCSEELSGSQIDSLTIRLRGILAGTDNLDQLVPLNLSSDSSKKLSNLTPAALLAP